MLVSNRCIRGGKSRNRNFDAFFKHRQTWLVGFATGLITLVSVNSYAQFVPTNDLGMVNGTELQQRTGNAIQAVCGGFLMETDEEMANRTVQQQDLFARCGELVQTNNALQDNGGLTGNSLGINESELNSALQNVAGEEIAAAGSLATESAIGQGDLVSRRFAAILSSVTRLQVSSLNAKGAGGVLLASAGQHFGQGGNAADSDLASEIPLGIYVNAYGGTSDKDVTDLEDGFDADSAGLAIGGEYRVKSDLVLGAMLGFQSDTVDYTTNSNVAGGGLDSDQVSLTAYGLYFSDDSYVDFVVGVGGGSYDLDRRVVIGDADGDPNTNTFDQTARADTDSQFTRFSLGGGKEFVRGRLTVAPFARMSLLDLRVDGYEESGADELNLRVNEQDINSLTIGGGARFVGTFSTGRAIILPQFSVEWVHELRNNSRQIVSTYVNDPRNTELTLVTDDPDENYFLLGFGASAVFTNGVQIFSELRSLAGLEDISQTLLSAGLRYEF